MFSHHCSHTEQVSPPVNDSDTTHRAPAKVTLKGEAIKDI